MQNINTVDIKVESKDTIAQAHVLLFNSFLELVETELSNRLKNPSKSDIAKSNLLNGSASNAAFSLIPEETRKQFGIFFSGHEISNLAASKISHRLSQGATVIDPACGAGDLLIACARHFVKQRSYFETLKYWSLRIGGIDLYDSFLNSVKSRLYLLATESLFAANSLEEAVDINLLPKFDLLYNGDGLSKLDVINKYDCVITNPPYGHISAPPDIKWATGKIQLAGLFIDKILEFASNGQDIVAILPDVLRSGSRYKVWRDEIARRADVLSIEIFGKFDKTTDVDVFLLHLKTSSQPKFGWYSHETQLTGIKRIDQFFKVHVGPVVPHRHKDSGLKSPYIDCTVTAGRPEVTPTKKIKFAGKKFQAPFVALHRTSSPDDKTRLVASIIISDEPVAVENHIIIVQPIDGKYETCVSLIKELQTAETKNWLNLRIRCRHLTVSAIKDIPLSDRFDSMNVNQCL